MQCMLDWLQLSRVAAHWQYSQILHIHAVGPSPEGLSASSSIRQPLLHQLLCQHILAFSLPQLHAELCVSSFVSFTPALLGAAASAEWGRAVAAR